MTLEKIVLRDKLALFHDHWAPKLIGAVNDVHIKLAKFKGEFVMHCHEHEDEMFWVLDGTLRLRLDDGVLELGPGEAVIVPKGVAHQPIAEEEVSVLLIEPNTTCNVGNATSSPLKHTELEHL